MLWSLLETHYISLWFFKYFFPAWQTESGKLPVLNLLTGQKSAFLPHRGHLLHRFTWNLAQPRGTWVHLVMQKFTPVGARGWERGPKMAKTSIFHPAVVNPFTDFYSFQGLLYARLPCNSILHLRWFGLLVTELLLRNRISVIYPEFFRAPSRKNCALDRKMIKWLGMVSTSSITMQSLMHAGWRCENIVFVCLYLFLSLSMSGMLFVRVGYNLNRYCVTVCGSILIVFIRFFQNGLSFQMH